MPTLPKDLRSQLAKVTLAARTRSESACRAALENLAVHEKEYRPHMVVEQRLLRNRLRAQGRAENQYYRAMWVRVKWNLHDTLVFGGR